MCENESFTNLFGDAPQMGQPPEPRSFHTSCLSPTYSELQTLLLDCIRACQNHHRLGNTDAVAHRLNVMEGLLSRKNVKAGP